jgi:predicted nucleic acid-binding protein
MRKPCKWPDPGTIRVQPTRSSPGFARNAPPAALRRGSDDDFDFLIGCSALTLNYAVVTNNIRHYDKIPGLKVVNWA